MLLSVGACLVFVASTERKISLLRSTGINIKRDETWRPGQGSRGKIHQAFWLSFCILEAIKNRSRGRPGNEASNNARPQLNNFLYRRAHDLRACIYTTRSIETMSEARERIKANVFFIHAMHPLQLGMAICYQYESAYFSAPCADNQLLCTLCDQKRSHASDSAGESKRNN